MTEDKQIEAAEQCPFMHAKPSGDVDHSRDPTWSIS
jgi:hypothetical protein